MGHNLRQDAERRNIVPAGIVYVMLCTSTPPPRIVASGGASADHRLVRRWCSAPRQRLDALVGLTWEVENVTLEFRNSRCDPLGGAVDCQAKETRITVVPESCQPRVRVTTVAFMSGIERVDLPTTSARTV